MFIQLYQLTPGFTVLDQCNENCVVEYKIKW